MHQYGEPVADSPRALLKRKIAEAEKKGLRMKSGVECEFFLITPDPSGNRPGFTCLRSRYLFLRSGSSDTPDLKNIILQRSTSVNSH